MENIIVNNVDITNLVTSFEVYEEMDKNLIIGSAVSTQIKLKLRNKDNQLEGLLDYPFIIGNKTYLVYEKPEKWTKSISLTLYDKMILANTPYDTKLEYPVTLSDQLDEISQISGIAIDKATLSPQLLSKEVNWYDNTMIIRNYIGFIAQCDGKNAFIENDKILFKGLAEQSHTTDFCSDYELNELITFSRVCFDDGLNILAKGDDTGKTLYVSSNNSYIEQSDIDRIYNMYNGLSFYSFKKFKCKDMGVKLTDLLSYGDITIMPFSIKRRVYGGEAKDSVELSGDITIKNADSVIIKENVSLKIKRIQTIVDQNEHTLQIVAKQQNELGSQQSEFKISLEGIQETIKKTEENVDKVFKNFTVYLETNRLANQAYDSNALTYIPDFFTNNLVITAHAYDLEGNGLNDARYEWKRKTETGLEPLVAGEHVNGNVLTISHNFDESVTFVCTATLDLISKKEEITVISTKTGKDGQDGQIGLQGPQGPAGKGIKSTAITYQAGTSGTTAPTGTWAASIPTVAQGQYLWSKTVITYTDNTTSTTYSVAYIPKNGTNGTNGATGATGTGVNTIVQQYYLSTSKTAQSGGSWVTAMPVWSVGKYLWTRFQINYKNPASTVYTTPVCDSSWEAANEVKNELETTIEDTSQSLSELIANARSELQSEITKNANNIIMEVSNKYYSKSGTDELIASISSTLTQTENDFLMKFDSITKVINDNAKSTDDEFKKISKYIQFSEEGIILGEDGTHLTLTIQNDRIVFKQSDKELAYFTNSRLFIVDGEFTQSLKIGQFAFVPRSNGSLDFKKVG